MGAPVRGVVSFQNPDRIGPLQDDPPAGLSNFIMQPDP